MDDKMQMETMLRPTPTRPFLGMTVLVVEDSLFACDAMRLMCLRSGARIRRADCLQSARRHLRVYRPTVVIADIGLPDGSGMELISELNGLQPRVPAILATSGDPDMEQASLHAGANGFMPKPISSLAIFQQMVIAALPAERRPNLIRAIEHEPVLPDPLAYQDDMAHAAELLGAKSDMVSLDYVGKFLVGVARSAEDVALEHASQNLVAAKQNGDPIQTDLARVVALVHDRLNEKLAM